MTDKVFIDSDKLKKALKEAKKPTERKSHDKRIIRDTISYTNNINNTTDG
jgi:hypothetical protein